MQVSDVNLLSASSFRLRAASNGLKEIANGVPKQMRNAEEHRTNGASTPTDNTTCQPREATGNRSPGLSPLRRLPQILELDLVQPAVEAAAGKQLLVSAHVENPPLVHHHNPIGQR